jgi:hypothetical protein
MGKIFALILSILAIAIAGIAYYWQKRNEKHEIAVMKLKCELDNQKLENAERFALLNECDDHTDDIDMMDTVHYDCDGLL